MPEEDVMEENDKAFDAASASLKECIKTIKTGVYGEDVRGAIAAGFEFVEEMQTVAPSIQLMGDLKSGYDLNFSQYLGSETSTDTVKYPYGVIYRLKGSITYTNQPSDRISGLPALFIDLKFGSDIKQFILYLTGGTNAICKFHTRVYHKVNNAGSWSGWTTVDLLDLSGSTQNVVLG